MIALIQTALSNLRTLFMLFALLMGLGIYAFFRIPTESQPDVSIPFANVVVSLEGISPEDADRMLVSPLYRELKSLPGLKNITSTAQEGSASVLLEFFTDVDIDEALDNARRRVDRAKPDLPEAATDPRVIEIDLNDFPVLVITLSGEVDEPILYRTAEQFKQQLESINGVLEIAINGKRDEVAEIIIDPIRMASYNLSHQEVFNVVSRNNQLVAAGNLDTGAGRFAVKVPGLITTEEDILNLPVKVDGDTVVRFRDIATGQRTYRDFQQLSRVNGMPAVTLDVKKRAGANIIDTLNEVKRQVEAASPLLPEGLQVGITQDQGVMIEQTLTELYNSVLLATLLVSLVIMWALGFRSATLVGIAIPASFITAIFIIYSMGLTLNIIVLFGLILTVGMLVDGAVVVVEYADRRMLEGAKRTVAFREAATRMAWPIAASTATTLAVFVPLLFIPGIAGDFMKYLPITVLVTLSASLVISLVIVPAFGLLIGKASKTLSLAEQEFKDHVSPTQLHGMTGYYVRFIDRIIDYPGRVLSAVLVLITVIVMLYIPLNRGVEFFPEIDSEFGSVTIAARGNLSLQERNLIVKEVESVILSMPEMKSVYSVINADSVAGAEDQIGRVQLEMVDWRLRDSSSEVMDRVLRNTAHIPGIRIERQAQAMGPASGVDIEIEFVSRDLSELRATVEQVTQWLNDDSRFLDVSNNLPLPGIEWVIDVDREAASRFGTDLSSVGTSIQMMTGGVKVGSYRPANADDELDIRLRYPFSGRELDRIDHLTLSVPGGQVPISNFISRRPELKQSVIERTRGDLALQVRANVALDERADLLRNEIIARYLEAVESGQLSDQVTPALIGDFQEQQEVMEFMMVAFIVAIFMILVILVTQFGSFYQTAVILLAVAFSTAGVLIGLMVTQQPFGVIMCGIGTVALAGIVVNNNIVLIDTYNYLVNQGMNRRNAILETCAQRLRPVILTTVTTILGLVPMMLGINIDFFTPEILLGAPSSQWWTQLSTAIAGGLFFASILTLVLTPSLLMARIGYKAKRQERLLSQENSLS